MNIRNQAIRLAFAALGAFSFPFGAQADCGGASVAEVKRAYAQAQKAESLGNNEVALYGYVSAQEYTCETNPVEVDAAKRAAALALPLAQAAEQRGEFERAFRLYDNGAHYAKADTALMTHVRANPDAPGVFEFARSHFENRALPAFQSNNAIRLKITGEYRVNAKYMTELLTLPAKGVERALQQDATAFNEQFLRDSVQLIQSRPDSPADFAGMQALSVAHQAFAQKWPEDLLKKSRQALDTLRRWGYLTRDASLAKSVEQSYAQRIEHHVEALTQRFSGSPQLLEAAMDYARMLNSDSAQSEPRVRKIKSQALQLGDAAAAKQRYALAADYYDAGGDDTKAKLSQERMKAAAMAKMQPSIDEMQRQAAAIQAQYADPEKIKAMQAQAEAMRKNLQQQQKAAKESNGKKADDLEKELGL